MHTRRLHSNKPWPRAVSAAFGGARRDEEKSRAKERVSPSAMARCNGIEESAPELWNLYNGRINQQQNEHSRLSPFQLD